MRLVLINDKKNYLLLKKALKKLSLENDEAFLLVYLANRNEHPQYFKTSILDKRKVYVDKIINDLTNRKLSEFFDIARNSKDFELAILIAKKLFNKSRDPIYFEKIFHCYWAMTEYAKAYNFIIQKIKKNEPIGLRLCRTIIKNLYGARDYETGYTIANYVRKKYPNQIRFHYLTCYFLMRQNKFNKSHKLWHKMENPYHSKRSILLQTWASWHLGDLKFFKKNLKNLKKIDKIEYSFLLGRYYLWQNKKKKVEKQIKIIQESSYRQKAIYLKAVLLALDNKNKEALKLFNKIEKYHTKGDKEFYSWRCEVKRKLKDFNGTRLDNETSRQFGYNLGSHINQILSQFDQGLGAKARVIEGNQSKVNHILYLEELAKNLPMLKVKDNNWPQALEKLLEKLAGNRSHIITTIEKNNLKAHLLKPYARVASRRIQLLIRTRGLARSILELKKLIKSYPYSAHPLTHIGEIYLWKGQLKKAEAMFRKALKKNGYVSWANIGLIASLLYQNRSQEALALCKVYERDFPPAPTLYIYIGEYYLMQKDFPMAKQYLQKAVFYRNNRITSYINICLYYLYQNRDKEAMKLFNFVEGKIKPLFFDIYEKLGVEKITIQNIEEVLFAVLKSMRGNRSSVLITYYYQKKFKFCNIEWYNDFPKVKW